MTTYILQKFLVVSFLLVVCNCQLEVVRDFIQFNVAGHPTLFKESSWPFDPDVGVKRSRLYQEVNGVLGEKAIERLGLGVDGNDLERLEQQKARDYGHLGGVDYLKP